MFYFYFFWGRVSWISGWSQTQYGDGCSHGFCCPSAGITGPHQHASFMWPWIKPRVSCEPGIRSTNWATLLVPFFPLSGFFLKNIYQLSMVIPIILVLGGCTQESQKGGQIHPWLPRKFEVNLVYYITSINFFMLWDLHRVQNNKKNVPHPTPFCTFYPAQSQYSKLLEMEESTAHILFENKQNDNSSNSSFPPSMQHQYSFWTWLQLQSPTLITLIQ